MVSVGCRRLPPPALGLYSPVPGSGKTALALALEQQGFVRVPFAAPLKTMVSALLLELGYGVEDVRELVQHRKEQPLPELDGVTPRRLLQTLGTEWGRQLIHPELWLRCWRDRAESILASGRPVVADDVRFANEAAAIEALPNGAMVRLRRPDAEALASAPVLAHASEGGLEDWPFVAELVNRGTLEQLVAQARLLTEQLGA